MEEARRFGRYRVTGTLGAGAMGEVFTAVDDVLGREVAVKTLKGHRNGLAARILDDRFRIEARAIAALSHPGVVAVFDIDLEADPPYLVMERVAGPSLKERLAGGPLTAHEVRVLGIQIGRALAAAHAQKIVHRDVKPANILAAGDGAWKLADFGVAHVPDSSLTMTGQFVGSPAYAAPEALLRGQCDAEADIYGLGATLYQAASGTWPRLDAAPSGALIPPVPPVRTFAPSLPPEIAEAIDLAVALDPGARPTAAALADALAGASSSAGAVPVTTPVAAPARLARWKPWVIGGAVAIAMIAVIAGTRGGGAGSSTEGAPAIAPAIAPMVAPASDSTPSELRITPPPMRDGKAEKEFRKVLEQIGRGHIEEAKRKLTDWERKHGGATPETTALRAQLDALGPDRSDPDRGPGHGRGED
ncbi:MAG: serine/threonine protein kinase [Myxococcales bacterium]|nr:serine/threonine protein kinase [Myxococcales bacterium]